MYGSVQVWTAGVLIASVQSVPIICLAGLFEIPAPGSGPINGHPDPAPATDLKYNSPQYP